MNPEVSTMQSKANVVTEQLAFMNKQSIGVLARVAALHEYLLGESIPQESAKGETPTPAGILESWIDELRDITERWDMIMRHFDNLKNV